MESIQKQWIPNLVFHRVAVVGPTFSPAIAH